ncbi:MAG: hypothetical protein K2R98_32780 [Gemmataceae bacterium]|nr:hypothetical protein [Gemmataceae bacterium]
MSERENPIERMHRAALEEIPPARTLEPPTIHYTELPEGRPDSPLRREWNTYLHEAGRLLAEGHAGRYVLVKGEELLGIWDTESEAMRTGYEQFLGQAFLVHQVQERERVLRSVSVRSCHNTLIPSRQAS